MFLINFDREAFAQQPDHVVDRQVGRRVEPVFLGARTTRCVVGVANHEEAPTRRYSVGDRRE